MEREDATLEAKQSAMAKFRADLELLEEAQQILRRHITTRSEEKTVDCTYRKDYATRTITFTLEDTGQIVETRQMTEAEAQRALVDEADEIETGDATQALDDLLKAIDERYRDRDSTPDTTPPEGAAF
jgi:hypothetical protein